MTTMTALHQENAPHDKRALLFPGQGSQCVGMGATFAQHPEAALVFEEVEDVLGFKLTKIMFEGPEETLRATENAQLALMTVSMACLRVMQARGFHMDTVDYVAGHSLGEITALCAAEALTLADATRLLRVRSLAMKEADPRKEGAMTAIMGLDIAAFDGMPQTKDQVCVVANDNGAGQVVISGHKDAVAAAGAWAKELKARVIPLSVAGAFHSPLMASAALRFVKALDEAHFQAPKVPLVVNVTAKVESDPVALKAHLKDQMTGRIQWRSSMDAMHQMGVRRFIEVGSGRVLTTLVRRHLKAEDALTIGTLQDIDLLQKD